MAEPQVIGRYVLHEALASGGMATVHLGRLQGGGGFSRTVAIKRMHAQFAQDPDFVAMFLEEARLAGRIRHPNVVSVIDVVATDNETLLVMEYVQGESLSKFIKLTKQTKQKIPMPIVSAIICDALDGLQAAHDARDEKGRLLGIVHRDVSPQNIMVGADGVARVLDFGIAKATGSTHVTREGQLKGKLSYMAPEQLHGKVSVATDVHAMGIVLWECLTGERLFAAESEGHTVTKILTETIEPPGNINEDAKAYDAVVIKALAREPKDRFASALEMSIALGMCARKAEAHEVAEWVSAVAKDLLDSRAEIVSDVESFSSTLDAHSTLGVPGADEVTALDPFADVAKRRPWRRILAIGSLMVMTAGTSLALRSRSSPSIPIASATVPPVLQNFSAALSASSPVAPKAAPTIPSAYVPATSSPPPRIRSTSTHSIPTATATENHELPDHL